MGGTGDSEILPCQSFSMGQDSDSDAEFEIRGNPDYCTAGQDSHYYCGYGKENIDTNLENFDIFSACSNSDKDDEENGELSIRDDSIDDSGSENDIEGGGPEAVKQVSAFHCNMNGYKTHAVDVEASIKLLDELPEIVMLNETKMDPGDEEVKLTGYILLCQRDRGVEGGGIAVFGRKDVSARMTLIHVSETFERCWVLVHTDEGPILMCCWYRPPGETIEGLHAFEEEMKELRVQAVAVMILGDLNIHQKSWLKYSSNDTPAGKTLQDICARAGLRQLVKTPTRKEHLLDLVLTDIPAKTIIGGKIQDHAYVLANLSFAIHRSKEQTREVWDYKNADWDLLQDSLDEENWDLLRSLDPDNGAATLTAKILELACKSIGRKTVK